MKKRIQHLITFGGRAALYLLAFSFVSSLEGWSQTPQRVAPLKSTAKLSHYESVCALSDTSAMAVGRFGLLALTRNGGKSWVVLSSPTMNHLFSVCTSTGDRVFVAGTGGTIMRGSANVTEWIDESSASFRSIDFRYVGELRDKNTYLGGTSGTIAVRLQSGEWKVIPTSFCNTVYSLAMNPRGDLFALCDSGFVAVQRVGSNTWDEIFNLGGFGRNVGRFTGMHFYNDSLAVLVGFIGANSALYTSSDGGTTFQPARVSLQSGGVNNLTVARNGFLFFTSTITGSRTSLWISADSGRTWSHKRVSSKPTIPPSSSMTLLGERRVVFVGSSGLRGSVDDFTADTSANGIIAGVEQRYAGLTTFTALAHLSDDETICTAGTEGTRIFRSKDRGELWDSLPGRLDFGFAIAVSAKHVFYFGLADMTYRAMLSGAHPERIPVLGYAWSAYANAPRYFLDGGLRSYVTNLNRIPNASQCEIRETTDGGDTWSVVRTIRYADDTKRYAADPLVDAFGSGYVYRRPIASDTNASSKTALELVYVDSSGKQTRRSVLPGLTSNLFILDDSSCLEYTPVGSRMVLVSNDGRNVRNIDAVFPLPQGAFPVYRRFSGSLICGVTIVKDYWILSLSPDNGTTWIFDTVVSFREGDLSAFFGRNLYLRERDTTLIITASGFIGAVIELKLGSYPIVRDRYVSSVSTPPGWAVGNQYLHISTSPSPVVSTIGITIHGLHSVKGEPLRLTVHDVNGVEVADWSAMAAAAGNGNYSQFNASFPVASSGVYFLRLRAGKYSLAQKVLVQQ